MKKVVEFTDKKVIEQEAASWLIKLDADAKLSAQDKAHLHEWLGRSPAHRKQLEQLAQTWNEANILTELAVPLNQLEQKRSLFTSLFLKPKRFVPIAASLLLAFCIGSFIYLDSTSFTQKNGLVATEIGDQRSIQLPDGSVVKLNTNSKVKIDYADEFRDIHLLQGEAHFEVAKDKIKPFRVYAGGGRIQAIGTAFSVYLKKDNVDVTVSEGRVGVASMVLPGVNVDAGPNQFANKIKPVKSLGMLRAGEAGTIASLIDVNAIKVQKLQNVRKIKNVETAKELSWTKGVLVFAGEPLDEVVDEISRYTSVAIEFADPDLKRIRIGGRFPVGETETMFSSLETNFGLQVTRLDSDRVIISGAR